MPDFDTFIFDMDGVVYRGETATPHAVEVLALLRELQKKVYFCTNNSSRSRKFFAEKILRLGIEAQKSEIMTSAYCAALWFVEQKIERPTVFVVGEDGIPAELEAIGARIVRSTNGPEPVEYVVAGIDRGVTYDHLMQAHIAICNGAQFIATNRDSTYPVETGTIPGAGAIVAAIETSTGVTPVVIGKPDPYIIVQILKQSQTPKARALVIGDRLDTDIRSGKRAGVTCALVLTGIATREEAQRAETDCAPDYVLNDLSELRGVLTAC